MASHPLSMTYGHCESYFVESDDEGLFARKADARERTRQLARERQRMIAEDLSRQTSEEYSVDILRHMEHMECETLPDVNSINIQTEIQWFMRPYLLDFLIEAHGAFQLLPETLYLAVNLLDRYCSKRIVYKRHYQLVGCAALLIASKFGDRKERVPTIRELKSMCCSLYEDEMFTQMEWHVLQTINWMVGHPTVDSFLQMALSESSYDPEAEHITWYISEIALFHKEFVSVRPSIIARSALALARCILGRSQSPQTQWSGCYDPHVVVLLSQQLDRPSSVLYRKYASAKFSSASSKVDIFMQRQAQMQRQVAPLTPPIDTSPMAQAKSSSYGCSSPHTPQKIQPAGITVYGYMTPPITPEGESNAGPGGNLNKSQSLVPHYYPSTPTPPSSVNNNQTHQYNYGINTINSVHCHEYGL